MATLADLRYVPTFSVTINNAPIPAALRASISSISYETALEGADRVELTLVNEQLRWLDNPLFRLDNPLTLSLGYAPDPLERIFVGEIVGQNAAFPGGGIPTLTVVAQDRRHRLQQGKKVRWFAVPVESLANYPLPDAAVAGIVSLENLLIPIGLDPITGFIGSVLSVLIGGVSILLAWGDPDTLQKLIRKQVGESDFELLSRIARDNGMEMLIDHSGREGGYKLRFLSLLAEREPEVTLRYGRSLVDFTPRLSNVGQIAGVTVRVWWSLIKTEFTVTLSWDWDRNALDLAIVPGFGLPAEASGTPKALEAAKKQAETQAAKDQIDKELAKITGPSSEVGFQLLDEVEEPVSLASAPRVLVGKLLPVLNKRLTGSGSTLGDPRIKAGAVLRLEGLGEQFGGLYRITSATHTLDGGGYRTSFEARKEVWFGSIPLSEQGAVPVRFQGQQLVRLG